ncbi:uncharacterized protein LOC130626192 isoform X2 [Hydractinia symbiolongicarpus]|uniref:uncharacterized protein LOC130626192 isoform X2 n=1 Tax=Hydractinia symbiolongicarpus TaxID=13093 RepID=UPI0025508539|nr:uncharacterized protein LOC130626192 isoform X2 [Hydractinia symbiolongicarpus]
MFNLLPVLLFCLIVGEIRNCKFKSEFKNVEIVRRYNDPDLIIYNDMHDGEQCPSLCFAKDAVLLQKEPCTCECKASKEIYDSLNERCESMGNKACEICVMNSKILTLHANQQNLALCGKENLRETIRDVDEKRNCAVTGFHFEHYGWKQISNLVTRQIFTSNGSTVEWTGAKCHLHLLSGLLIKLDMVCKQPLSESCLLVKIPGKLKVGNENAHRLESELTKCIPSQNIKHEDAVVVVPSLKPLTTEPVHLKEGSSKLITAGKILPTNKMPHDRLEKSSEGNNARLIIIASVTAAICFVMIVVTILLIYRRNQREEEERRESEFNTEYTYTEEKSRSDSFFDNQLRHAVYPNAQGYRNKAFVIPTKAETGTSSPRIAEVQTEKNNTNKNRLNIGNYGNSDARNNNNTVESDKLAWLSPLHVAMEKVSPSLHRRRRTWTVFDRKERRNTNTSIPKSSSHTYVTGVNNPELGEDNVSYENSSIPLPLPLPLPLPSPSPSPLQGSCQTGDDAAIS